MVVTGYCFLLEDAISVAYVVAGLSWYQPAVPILGTVSSLRDIGYLCLSSDTNENGLCLLGNVLSGFVICMAWPLIL